MVDLSKLSSEQRFQILQQIFFFFKELPNEKTGFYETDEGRGYISWEDARDLLIELFPNLAEANFRTSDPWKTGWLGIKDTVRSGQEEQASVPNTEALLAEKKAAEEKAAQEQSKSSQRVEQLRKLFREKNLPLADMEAEIQAIITAENQAGSASQRAGQQTGRSETLAPSPSAPATTVSQTPAPALSKTQENERKILQERAAVNPPTLLGEPEQFLTGKIVPALKQGFYGVGEAGSQEETGEPDKTASLSVEKAAREQAALEKNPNQFATEKQIMAEGKDTARAAASTQAKTQPAVPVSDSSKQMQTAGLDSAKILGEIATSPGVKNFFADNFSQVAIYGQRFFQTIQNSGLPGWVGAGGALLGLTYGNPLIGVPLGFATGFLTADALQGQFGGSGGTAAPNYSLPSSPSGRNNLGRAAGFLGNLSGAAEGWAGVLTKTSTAAVTRWVMIILAIILLVAIYIFIFVLPSQVRAPLIVFEKTPPPLFTVTKEIVSVNGQSITGGKIANIGSGQADIVYKVTLTAQGQPITLQSPTDKATSYKSGRSPTEISPAPELQPGQNYPSQLSANESKTVTMHLTVTGGDNSFYDDSRLINEFTVTGVAASPEGGSQTRSASVTLVIGTPVDSPPYGFPLAGPITTLDYDTIEGGGCSFDPKFPRNTHCGEISANQDVYGGLDIGSTGAVKSPLDGVIDSATFDKLVGGRIVIRSQSGEYLVAFIHINDPTGQFKKGDQVSRGQTIGSVYQGTDLAYAKGQHLHYQILRDGANEPFATAPAGPCSPSGDNIMSTDMQAEVSKTKPHGTIKPEWVAPACQ